MAGRFTVRRAAAPEPEPALEEPSPALEGVSWTVFPEPAPEPAAQASVAIRCSATSCSTPRSACTAG